MKRSTARLWFAFALCAVLLAAALMLLFYVNTPRSSEVIAAATATRAISTPLVVETTPPIAATDTPSLTITPSITGLPAVLTDIPQATSIKILDGWGGMVYPSSRIDQMYRAEFILKLQGTELTGVAQFEVGFGNAIQKGASKINIPSEASQKFLRSLAGTEGTKGNYTPRIDHTDDFPYIEIEVTTPRGSVLFRSLSQGRERVPWAVNILSDEFVVNTNTISRAYEDLAPYLHWDIAENLASNFYTTQQTQVVFNGQTISAARTANATPKS